MKGKDDYLYSAIYILYIYIYIYTNRSGMDHTVLPANTAPPLTEVGDIQLQLTTLVDL